MNAWVDSLFFFKSMEREEEERGMGLVIIGQEEEAAWTLESGGCRRVAH
jgi:hypothetical protein